MQTHLSYNGNANCGDVNFCSEKQYILKQKNIRSDFDVLSIEYIKNYLKISSEDGSHDESIKLFRGRAVEFAQQQLKSIILPVEYEMQIGTNLGAKIGYNNLLAGGMSSGIYYQLYKAKICMANIAYSKFDCRMIALPVSPVLQVAQIIVDGAEITPSEIIFNNFNNTILVNALNGSFENASVTFVAGCKNNDEIASDIITAILNHIYFMWVDESFTIAPPSSTLDVYKAYSRLGKIFRV